MKRLMMLGAALMLACSPVQAQTMVKVKAGMVTGIDQIGLPIALERGFFEKNGLDVTVRGPTPPALMRSTRCRLVKAKLFRLAYR